MNGLTIRAVNMKDITAVDTDYQNETGYLITDGFAVRFCENRKDMEDFLKMQKEHPLRYLDCDNEESDCTCCSMNHYGYDCHNYPADETRDMRSTSVIARRKKDGTVQFGMVNNGKDLRNVGIILDCWYSDPRKVDYLFSKWQLSDVGEPYSENSKRSPETYKNYPTGLLYGKSETEVDIFSRVASAECGYFYDTDCNWYYLVPGPFTLKIPYQLMSANLKEDPQGFEFLNMVWRMTFKYIIDEYPKDDPEFAVILEGCDKDKLREVLDLGYSPLMLWIRYPMIVEYFDNWVVVLPDAEGKNVDSILVRKREEPRKETIDWPGHPVHETGPYFNHMIVDYALAHVAEWLESVLEAREYNKAQENNGKPVKEVLPCDVPEWFLEELEHTEREIKETAIPLLKWHMLDLYHLSKAFRQKLLEEARLGRVAYDNIIERCKHSR